MADVRKESVQKKRICPICGWRERRADCLLGVKCRREFDEEVVMFLASGTVLDMFDYAAKKGKETLERLRVELRRTEILKQEGEKSLWLKAKEKLRDNINSFNVPITKGIYDRALRRIYLQCRDQDEDHKAVSRKAYALKKALEDLIIYLQELPEMRNRAQLARLQSERDRTLKQEQENQGRVAVVADVA